MKQTKKSKGSTKDTKRASAPLKSASQRLAKSKKTKKGPNVVPIPTAPDSDDDNQLELDQDDLEFVTQHANNIGFLHSLPTKELDKAVSQAKGKVDKGTFNRQQPLPSSKKRKSAHNDSATGDDDDNRSDSDEEPVAGNGLSKQHSNDSEEQEDSDSAEDTSNDDDDDNDSDEDDIELAWAKRSHANEQKTLKSTTTTTTTTTTKRPAANILPVKTLDGVLVKDPSTLKLESTIPHLSKIPGLIIHDDLSDALEREKVAGEQRNAKREAERKLQQEEEEEERLAAEEEQNQKHHHHQQQQQEEEDEDNDTLREIAAYHSIEERRTAAKHSMALSCQALLADPEGQLSKHLKNLLSMLGDGDVAVRRLAMLSLLLVFKDLLPGYRIRSHEEELNGPTMISKDVKKLWEYEASLLKCYQQYLKSLLNASKTSASKDSNKNAAATARIAVKCMCGLLSAAPHFNYSGDLLQALVPNMVHKDEKIREMCCNAVAELGEVGLGGSTDAGSATVEAVQLVADLIRKRKCVVGKEVVLCLLGLSFPEIKSGEDFEEAKRSRKAIKKKARKKAKDEVSRAFKEAQAVADLESRRNHQSSTLEALFEIFFRVLKTCTSSGLLLPTANNNNNNPNNNNNNSVDTLAVLSPSRFSKRFPLLAPSLEGLSKFSHLISIDYFSDLMVVLEELLESPALPPAVRLRCLLTAAEILKGQGESLNIDRRTFHVRLYSALDAVSLVPLNEVEPPFPVEENNNNNNDDDDDDDDNGQSQRQQQREERELEAFLQQHLTMQSDNKEVPLLLSQLLDVMILDSKLLDAARQAAFSKRIAGAAAAVGDTGGAVGMLCVLQRMLRRQPKLRSMLENEAGGPSAYKTYRPEIEDPAEAGALSTALWELPLLSRHYHPHIARIAADISGANMSSTGTAGSTLLPLGTTPVDLARKYGTGMGGFFPPPQIPRNLSTSSGSAAGGSSKKSNNAHNKYAAQNKALPLGDAFVSEYLQNNTGEEEDDVVDEVAVALKQYFKANKQFVENVALRRELRVVSRQLQAFDKHIVENDSKKKVNAVVVKGKRKGGEVQNDDDGVQKEKKNKKSKKVAA